MKIPWQMLFIKIEFKAIQEKQNYNTGQTAAEEAVSLQSDIQLKLCSSLLGAVFAHDSSTKVGLYH